MTRDDHSARYSKIRSVFLLLIGGCLLYTAVLHYIHPPSGHLAINGFSNFLTGLMGGILTYGAYGAYRRRDSPKPPKPGSIAPGMAMRLMLLVAAFLFFLVFFPLVWPRLGPSLLFRLTVLAYLFFEIYQAYRRRNEMPVVLEETAQSERGIRIVAGIVIAFGVVGIGAGLWFAEFEWSRVTRWPRATGVLVDKEILPVGARLIFEYQVGGTRSAGRVYRYGGEDEMRTFLELYRAGNNYPITYNPNDPGDVEFHLGYHWDLFRTPIAVVFFSLLFVAAGIVLGTPWLSSVGQA